MIKVGILGAESLMAGELLRLLVHHPEVELINISAPALRGRLISSYHRGLTGDTDLKFTDRLDLDKIDLLFITSEDYSVDQGISLPEDLKVIVIQQDETFTINPPFDKLEFVPGVSEMFRKRLVRNANASRILSSPTTVALIALFPLALHLLLNDTLDIKVKYPEFLANNISKEGMTNELESLLKLAQLSFNKINDIQIERYKTLRAINVDIEFQCNISVEEIERIYNDIYDDHNFTFLVRVEPYPTEVAGTHKCLLYITKPTENTVRVKAIADSVLRGGAGDAIHAMNLLFGLFEKIGLNLPASLAFKNQHDIYTN